jgi:hypothetical protein
MNTKSKSDRTFKTVVLALVGLGLVAVAVGLGNLAVSSPHLAGDKQAGAVALAAAIGAVATFWAAFKKDPTA